MIEKGLTPPDLPNERKTLTPQDCLRRGTVMLFLGIGIAVGLSSSATGHPIANSCGWPAWPAPSWASWVSGTSSTTSSPETASLRSMPRHADSGVQ